MKITKRIISKKDIIVPKGTIFECIDGSTSHYCYDNYNNVIALDKDTSAEIIVSSENKEYFKEIKDSKWRFTLKEKNNERHKTDCCNNGIQKWTTF